MKNRSEYLALFPCITASAAETRGLGERVSKFTVPGDVFALTGPLGSGKTQFSKGLAHGFGIDPSTVTSPTFSLVNEYTGREKIVHLDLYRLESAEEVGQIGLDELLTDQSIILIEWPHLAAGLLPHDTVVLSFEHLTGDQRRIDISTSDS